MRCDCALRPHFEIHHRKRKLTRRWFVTRSPLQRAEVCPPSSRIWAGAISPAPFHSAGGRRLDGIKEGRLGCQTWEANHECQKNLSMSRYEGLVVSDHGAGFIEDDCPTIMRELGNALPSETLSRVFGGNPSGRGGRRLPRRANRPRRRSDFATPEEPKQPEITPPVIASSPSTTPPVRLCDLKIPCPNREFR